MQVSVETLDGLKRKVDVSFPETTLQLEVDDRFKKMAKTAKIDGFRPGKVPMSILKQRFSQSVLVDVANQLLQPTIQEVCSNNDLMPASYPEVTVNELELGKPFKFSFVLEVFPKIDLLPFEGDKVIQLSASITDTDVDTMIERLLDQHKTWSTVERVAKLQDKVILNFDGKIDGEAMQGGSAKQFELVLGSGSMIPGFEEAMIGKGKGEAFSFNITFPADYHATEIAGKEAIFDIQIHDIHEGQKPELDESFAQKFNIQEGGVDAFRADIRLNMERELNRRLRSLNSSKVIDAFVAKNPILIPEGLVEEEIKEMKHEFYHQVFGHQHQENEQIPDFPRELFADKATKRVHTGLVCAEFVKVNNIQPDVARVNERIDELATAYEDKTLFLDWIRRDKDKMREIESLVVEDMLVELLLAKATIEKTALTYDEAMKYEEKAEHEGE